MTNRSWCGFLASAAMVIAGLGVAPRAQGVREQPQESGQLADMAQGAQVEVPPGVPLTVSEVERMWDSYLAAQAKTALGLGEPQFLRFAARLQNLQNLRRQHHRRRRQLMGELSDMVRGQAAEIDREAVTAKLRELDEWGVEAARQTLRSYTAIDAALNIRQRVRFRTFEERMTQQKLELLAEARRAARGRGQGPGRQPDIR